MSKNDLDRRRIMNVLQGGCGVGAGHKNITILVVLSIIMYF